MVKFSVKKPLTVLVAVIIVLVLGIVSLTRMTPDLMPNMDMPVVMVVTSYPGATPEEVETNLTKPLEESMSTLENIDKVSSTSSSNVSMLTLQFTDNVNMDTVSVDILQKINQISENWDDAIGTPYILKMNPNIIPVVVTAVSYDGMNDAQLSAFVNETLLNKLEGTNGVASISVNGAIDEKIQVVLNQKKIDKLNKKIKKSISSQFDDAESQLEDAQAQIDSGKAEIESGKEALESGKEQLADQTSSASAEISSKQAEINKARTQILTQLSTLQTQKQELATNKSALQSLQTTIDQLNTSEAQAKDTLQKLQEASAASEQLQSAMDAFNAQLEAISANTAMTEEEKEAARNAILNSNEYKQTAAGLAALDAQLQAMGMTRDSLPEAIAQAEAALAQIAEGNAQIDSSLASMGLTRDDLSSALQEISDAEQKVSDAETQLNATLEKLDSGEIQLKDAMKELEKQKTNAIFKLSETSAQLIAGESTLASSQAQVDSGLDELNRTKESAYESADLDNILTVDNLTKILAAQNFSMPSGYVSESGTDYLVSVGEKIGSAEDMSNLVVLDLNMDGISQIKLSDIADISTVNNSDEIYANIDGEDGILLSFSKQSTYATAEVSDNINQKIEELKKEYPGLNFSNLMDQGNYIYTIISSILQSLVLGAIFAIVILFLFLRDIKPTFVVLCSIPISILFAFTLMYFSGVTLNMISMSGLAVAVGMLVDNSVVVIENIYRLRSKGVSALKSAILGATQVAGAIVASTLTTVCVFLPIIFVEGITRQLFTDLALTLGYSLLASLLVALTLVPSLSSRILQKPIKPKRHRIMDMFLGIYEKALRWTLRFKPVVLIGAVVLLVGSGALALSRGFIFMPETDATEISLNLEMPETAVLEDTRKTANEALSRIGQMEGIKSVGAMLSSSDGSTLSIFGAGAVSERHVIIYATLEDHLPKSSKELTNDILEACSDLDGTFTVSDMMSSSGMMGTLTDNGITVRVYGNELHELQDTANLIAEKLDTIEGTTEVSNGIEETDPEIQFIVDKKKAMKYGLTVAQVYQEISSAITLETRATTVNYDGNQYDVMIAKSNHDNITPSYIKNYKFKVTQQDGTEKTVKLTDIADIIDTETLTSIERVDQKRYLEVTAKLEDGYNVSLTTDKAKAALEEMDLPAEISYEFTGGSEDIMASIYDLVKMLLLGVLLVYLVMVAQFQSLKHPFIVMFTIPLAFTGGLLALLITGMEVSVISMIGFVMLCGIIVNNGIVLVDYVNQLRIAGVPKREALVEAGKTRMRPIFMTTVTTILGLIVMALGIGGGNQMMQPIAVVCIGGLLYGTLLTLFVVPVIYDLMNRKDMKRPKKEDLDITAEEMLDDEYSDFIKKHQNTESGPEGTDISPDQGKTQDKHDG